MMLLQRHTLEFPMIIVMQKFAVRPESSAADEVANFLQQTNVTRQQDPLEWWKLHDERCWHVADVR